MQWLCKFILYPVATASYVSTSSYSGCSTSYLAFCLWPGKGTVDGLSSWDPEPTQETQHETPSFQVWLSSPLAILKHLGSEPADVGPFLSLSPFLSIQYAFQIKIKYSLSS